MNNIVNITIHIYLIYSGFFTSQAILIGLFALTKRFQPTLHQHKNILIASCTIPHILWFAAIILNDEGKSLVNAVDEPIIIGFILAIINAIYIILLQKKKTYWIASLIIVPLAVYFLVPGLME